MSWRGWIILAAYCFFAIYILVVHCFRCSTFLLCIELTSGLSSKIFNKALCFMGYSHWYRGIHLMIHIHISHQLSPWLEKIFRYLMALMTVMMMMGIDDKFYCCRGMSLIFSKCHYDTVDSQKLMIRWTLYYDFYILSLSRTKYVHSILCPISSLLINNDDFN